MWSMHTVAPCPAIVFSRPPPALATPSWPAALPRFRCSVHTQSVAAPLSRSLVRFVAPAVAGCARSRCISTSRSLLAKKKRGKLSGSADLDETLARISDIYGTGALQVLEGEDVSQHEVDAVPTGSLGLDLALGIGGLPKRRIVEIYGPEASGKTTLALSTIAQAQKMGGRCTFIDVEHALDPRWARRLGVNTKELLFSQPDSGEEALEIADTLVSSGHMDVIVIDSVAALVPRSELEGDMGDSQVGVQARLMSHALRKLTASISKSNTLLIFINQIRMKIGVLFGSPETTSGGNALKFYSSVRLDVRRFAQLKSGDEVIGNQIRVKVVKNKVAPPFRVAEFDIIFDQGFSREGEVLDHAVTHGLVAKSGSWYTIPSNDPEEEPIKLGQGREKARVYLEQDRELTDLLEARIRHIVLRKNRESLRGDEDDVDKAEAEAEASNPALDVQVEVPPQSQPGDGRKAQGVDVKVSEDGAFNIFFDEEKEVSSSGSLAGKLAGRLDGLGGEQEVFTVSASKERAAKRVKLQAAKAGKPSNDE